MSEAPDPVAAIFCNQGLHANAKFIASLHDNARDYLEQAPVLALCFGAKRNTRSDRLYVASRIGGPIARGERLRSVMAAVGVPYPLRKLSGNALTPSNQSTVRALAAIDPSTLSQSIPSKVGQQRQWLSAIWRYRLRSELRRHVIARDEFRWLVTQAARNTSMQTASEAEDIADFVDANGQQDWARWTWARALGETNLWHDRLAADKALPAGFNAGTVIDYSDWPDHIEIEGYEFFKLSTPGLLMEEGRRMRHCVASYMKDVVNGSCSIFSIRHEMRRVATLQIASKRIIQLKGFANRDASLAVWKAARAFLRLEAA